MSIWIDAIFEKFLSKREPRLVELDVEAGCGTMKSKKEVEAWKKQKNQKNSKSWKKLKKAVDIILM